MAEGTFLPLMNDPRTTRERPGDNPTARPARAVSHCNPPGGPLTSMKFHLPFSTSVSASFQQLTHSFALSWLDPTPLIPFAFNQLRTLSFITGGYPFHPTCTATGDPLAPSGFKLRLSTSFRTAHRSPFHQSLAPQPHSSPVAVLGPLTSLVSALTKTGRSQPITSHQSPATARRPRATGHNPSRTRVSYASRA